jgi:hypothetical protein
MVLAQGVASPAAAPLARRLQQFASSALRQRCGAVCVQRPGRATLTTQASADGAGVLAKLGRVLKEKAQADIDRIFKVRPACRAIKRGAGGCSAQARCDSPAHD